MFDVATFGLSVITAGGGSAVIAVGLFKTLGNRWMESRFAARLQDLKHDHDREMAHIKSRIDSQLDRTTRLHQREFEILPDLWAKIDTAHHAALFFIAPGRRYHDFSAMGDEQFEETLSREDLSDWQKDELRDLDKASRNKYYFNAIYWHELWTAKRASGAASDALSKGALFLNPATFSKLDGITTEIYEAIRTKELNRELGDSSRDDPAAKYRREGQTRYEALRSELQNRLWPEAP